MANIKSFPNNQDTYIGAEEVMRWHHGRTSGVFAGDDNVAVSALPTPGMVVTVSDGIGWLSNVGKNGIVWWVDNESVKGSKLQLSIDPADGVLNRIDRIVVEWRTTNYVDYPEVKVLKGETSSNAVAPALTNDSTVRQISLARVSVPAGITAITSSMIMDERLDMAVCGLVTETVALDTSTMYAQFAGLLDGIQQELMGLEAGTAVELRKMLFLDTTVQASAFLEDSTYEDYPYRAAIELPGVIATMIPEVVYSASAIANTEFSPVAESYNGGVYIYAEALPEADVNIPTIICWKASGGSGTGDIGGTSGIQSVNGQSPDENGNVALTAENIGALPLAGGSLTGELSLSGNRITKVAAPTEATDVANMDYVDSKRLTRTATLSAAWSGTGRAWPWRAFWPRIRPMWALCTPRTRRRP